MNKLIFLILYLLTLSRIGESQSSENEALNWSINPDSYSFSLESIQNKWNSKLGGSYLIRLVENNKFEMRASVGAFVNLKNFSENLAFSWQLWRGNVGAELFINVKNRNWLPANSRIEFQVKYAHESQHATDVDNYVINYLEPGNMYFDNAGIRSFEYIVLATEYKQQRFKNKVALPIQVGYKYFPKPALKHTKKMLDYSLFLELGIQWQLEQNKFLYTSVYIENIRNSYDNELWGYLEDLKGEELKYRLMETGIVFKNQKEQSLGAYFYYSNSNGRSLDFVDTIEGWGIGTRFFL